MKKKISKTKKLKKDDITKPPASVKTLGALMKDEDGFVSKETILKVGLSTVGALGIAGMLTQHASGDDTPYQQREGSSHNNVINLVPNSAGVANAAAQHTNVTTHVSY